MPVESGNLYVEKRLSSREVSEPEAIARLASEASLLKHLARLDIAPRLLDHGEDARGPWLRTEALNIPTVTERLQRGRIEPTWIETATRACLHALQSLHHACDSAGRALDVVHADLSPSNVAIDDAGHRVVILDFDLAWWRDGPSRDDGAFRGTLAYVAPEVARGERPTPKSDLFSLGAVLLHAATGIHPRLVDPGVVTFAAALLTAGETPIVVPDAAALRVRGRSHAAILELIAHDPADRPSAEALLKSL